MIGTDSRNESAWRGPDREAYKNNEPHNLISVIKIVGLTALPFVVGQLLFVIAKRVPLLHAQGERCLVGDGSADAGYRNDLIGSGWSAGTSAATSTARTTPPASRQHCQREAH